MGSFSVECRPGDGERTAEQADGERRVRGEQRMIEPMERWNAARAFGAESKLQTKRRGRASRKLIIDDKSPALATRQCWLLYPEGEKMQH